MDRGISATRSRVHLVSRALGVESEEAQHEIVRQEGGAKEGGKR